MNAQVQKLAEQAGLFIDINGELWPRAMVAEESVIVYQNFAALIVRECIAICENNDFPKNPDLFEHGWDGGLQNAQERMMNHFGVT